MSTGIVTMKQFMQRAYELVAKGWVQGQLYTGWQDDETGEDDENMALLPKYRSEIQSVCSVGAMRLAFAELVGVPIHQEPAWTYSDMDGEERQVMREWVDEQELIRHPFYQEGMRVLGRAFYRAEQLSAYREQAIDNPEKLLNGDEGRPYTVNDVGHSIIGVNDHSVDELDLLEEAIIEAFRQAVELAPEDVTAEATGDHYLTTVENGNNGLVPA